MTAPATDPTGCSFLSYRRSRSTEAARLIAAQRERGIPTWRDVDDMNTEPTEDELRRILRDRHTANAILWVTPETAESGMIRKVEAPVAFERHGRSDGFFIVPVAAGGLDYAGVAKAIGPSVGAADIGGWNIIRMESDPASEADIAQVANSVLKQRLQSIDPCFTPDEPLRIVLNTRQPAWQSPGTGLTIDWGHRFGGIQNREASPADWQDKLLPALADVGWAIQQTVPGRKLLASGLTTLSAATALGCEFMATAGLDIAWKQQMPDGSAQIWGLNAASEDSGFAAETSAGNVNAADLAVMVSVNNDVGNAVTASLAALPPFRAWVHVRRADSARSAMLTSPGQALDVAKKTIAAARNARGEYEITGRVHLFTAAPAGLAMLIGRLSNTLGPTQTYEHIPSGATGHYQPAALLNAR